MNHGIPRLFTLCMPVVLLLAGCQPKLKTFVPVTGVKETTLPALVEQSRASVLEYVLSSSRLATLPSEADWQLDTSQASEGLYRFRSGDWLIMIWLADADKGNQRVIILNKAENASWGGYVTPDGHVVDTSYSR
jgi:hypothetical protein